MSMPDAQTPNERTVFVTGAGFTKAFVPDAPLLRDDYGIAALAEKFEGFGYVEPILKEALGAAGRPRECVDLESLMTRVSGMPYDNEDARRELALLDVHLRRALVSRIGRAKKNNVNSDGLAKFAKHVVNTRGSIVTFNYDDVLDQALWEVRKATDFPPSDPYWHPDGGYGFFCRPAMTTVAEKGAYMDRVESSILKLHGSLNWRLRLGDTTPHGPAAILHHEEWLPFPRDSPVPAVQAIETHLEREPFIVPPVLAKTISMHPVLQMIWAGAHRALKDATRIIFLGYSLPITDLAARTLFKETLGDGHAQVTVVGYTDDGQNDQRIVDAYQETLGLKDIDFDFQGAESYVARLPQGD